jgi:sensor histidine kinase regulating citrate/malate metabolism
MVRVYMDVKEPHLYISVTNLCAGKKMAKINGRFLSHRGEGHGFGLVRIDGIVERSGGYVNRNSEDGAFTTEILLPLE